MSRSWRLPAAGLALFTLAGQATGMAADTGDVLARSRAVYATLRSYSDTGMIEVEYGSASVDRHSFGTYFNRMPRGFYLEFKKQGGDRYVIWGDPEAFHTWWKTTGVRDDYPNPNNLGAFSTAGFQTAGSATKIPTLLYSKAPLQGPFSNFENAVVDGMEEVGGRRCYRLAGGTHDVYRTTGRVVNTGKMTVWIDAESFLIRRVREEPAGTLPGQRNRTTTTYEPRANPALDERPFHFVPPAAK